MRLILRFGTFSGNLKRLLDSANILNYPKTRLRYFRGCFKSHLNPILIPFLFSIQNDRVRLQSISNIGQVPFDTENDPFKTTS